jgi:positive regulator of sigma E activity
LILVDTLTPFSGGLDLTNVNTIDGQPVLFIIDEQDVSVYLSPSYPFLILCLFAKFLFDLCSENVVNSFTGSVVPFVFADSFAAAVSNRNEQEYKYDMSVFRF